MHFHLSYFSSASLAMLLCVNVLVFALYLMSNLTIYADPFRDLVLEAGFKFPLNRVIYIDESDESESLFEYIDNHIRSKPHQGPDFNIGKMPLLLRIIISYQHLQRGAGSFFTLGIKHAEDGFVHANHDRFPEQVMSEIIFLR